MSSKRLKGQVGSERKSNKVPEMESYTYMYMYMYMYVYAYVYVCVYM